MESKAIKPGLVMQKGRSGDPDKRTCQYYACCQNLKEVWEDERGSQLECKVCGAAIFAAAELANDD